jgi:hypothetical protein
MHVLRKRARRASSAFAALLVAAVCLVSGISISHRTPAQITDYNRAMAAYQSGDVKKAMDYLDASLADYDAAVASPWWQRAVNGRPNTELAAQAHFHKGVLLLMLAQAEHREGLIGQAVEELEASLELNPGEPYGNGVSRASAKRLNEEALVVKHDLDLLFQKHPEQQSNGKGKPQDGQGKPAPAGPGNDPGSMPGHGNDDGI